MLDNGCVVFPSCFVVCRSVSAILHVCACIAGGVEVHEVDRHVVGRSSGGSACDAGHAALRADNAGGCEGEGYCFFVGGFFERVGGEDHLAEGSCAFSRRWVVKLHPASLLGAWLG